MRALEASAVTVGTSLDELMEQAGLAVAQEAWLSLGVVEGRRILVLAGPGNNGGDGLVAARHLAGWGADVVVYLLAPRSGDKNFDLVAERGVPAFVAAEDEEYASLQHALDGAEMVIDALLGTGHSRPIDGALADVLRRLRAAAGRPTPPKIIAVDLPTGVDADSGRADPLAVRADMTVTFGLAKVGLYMLPGSEHAGLVQVVDIGLPKDAEAAVPLDLLGASWVRERLPKRPASANKGTFGRVLVVAGSANYAGAARLAAEACYRAGAGLVTVACPASVQPMIAPAIAEATWLPLADDAGALSGRATAQIIDALPSYDVLLIGPGLSQRDGVREAVVRVLAAVPPSVRACVIDADALNALAHTPNWGQRIPTPVILTPHPGEMARLLGGTVADVQDDRLNVSVNASADWRQVVVLKGAHTVVAAPDGRAAISPHANPLLASAGTGDVLAGAIAGLLSQGMAPFEAAACGVYLHGLAAEEIGEEMGDRGMLASQLLPALPRAMRTVLHGRPSRGRALPFTGLGDLRALVGQGGAAGLDDLGSV
jgi:NAD(P)H-hydrate epimerase